MCPSHHALQVRFGLELEEVNKAVPAWQEGEEGEEGWVCPHCYELEHPDEVRARMR